MSYPKKVWILVESEVTVENGKEVIQHLSDRPVGGTFQLEVAEKLFSILKDNEGQETMIMSTIQTLPEAVLDCLPEPPKTTPSVIDEILTEMEKK